MQHLSAAPRSIRLMAVLAPLLGSVLAPANFAKAGPVLITAGPVAVSRQTAIDIVGKAGIDSYNLWDGTDGLGMFSNSLGSAQAPPVLGVKSTAHQQSNAGIIDEVLTGAFAEGSVSADDEGAPDSESSALSSYELVFKVISAPSAFSLGGVLGAQGNAWASVKLGEQDSSRLLIDETAGKGLGVGQTINRLGMLSPGTYDLSVEARGTGTLDLSSAYFSVNLILTPAPASIPLPPALWTGLSTLAALGGAGFCMRRAR